MNKSIDWYTTVLEKNKELELSKQGDVLYPLHLNEQTKILIQLFNECSFVGFPSTDIEAKKIISNVLTRIQNSLTDKLDFEPGSLFFMCLGLCNLERVLQVIKHKYENAPKVKLNNLENIIYKSEDFENLIEVSYNMGRYMVNNQSDIWKTRRMKSDRPHPDFGILKEHFREQLNYVENKQKWLKENGIDNDYKNDFKLRDFDSYEFELESINKNKKAWWKWIIQNEELADIHYPVVIEGIIKRLRGQEPFQKALFIQEMPDTLEYIKQVADSYTGIRKQKFIQEWIEFIKEYQSRNKYATSIEQKAFDEIQEELKETLTYLENATKSTNTKQVKQVKKTSSKKGTKEEKNPITFENLFSSLEEANASINILKNVKPPIINENGDFILGSRSKGAITAWIQALKRKGKISTCTDKDIAVLLNAKIPNLKIDERTLRNTGTTAYTKYFTQILALI